MSKHSVFKLILAAFLLIMGFRESYGQTSRAETEIKEIMKELDVVGLSVAVVKKGKLIYNKSFGLKNIASNTPLTNEDIFRIASISKSFSATSIMQLIEAGKLSLDDDFSKLVGFTVRNPKFPQTVITLRMVMSHTASINDSQGYFTLDAIDPAKGVNYAKCYNDYEPGTQYQYCNLDYNMTGTVIERVSGERFDQYVRNHVLRPLNLYGGYCVDSLDANRFATIYDYDSTHKLVPSEGAYDSHRLEIQNYVMGRSTPIFSPTGGMKISAADLASYMTMHMYRGKYKGVRIISRKSSRIMQTTVAKKEGYALAIMHTDKLIPGRMLTGHTGVAYGLYSAMFFDPKKKFGIVVITNGCNPVYKDGYNLVIRRTVNSLYESLIR
ncbi:MAG: serine hydrolase domain-containing protein [Flavisolibacter sp.]